MPDGASAFATGSRRLTACETGRARIAPMTRRITATRIVSPRGGFGRIARRIAHAAPRTSARHAVTRLLDGVVGGGPHSRGRGPTGRRSAPLRHAPVEVVVHSAWA